MFKKLVLVIPLFLLAAGVHSAPQKDEEEKNVKVSIRNSQFEPKRVTLKMAQTVVWTNNDPMDHTVKANDGSFKSGTLKRKGTFEHTFNKAGKFPYGCTLHPRMKGTVTVE